MKDAFICDAVRTPIGRYGGALAAVRTDDLAAIPLKALLERNSTLDPAAIDDVILGCANQAGEDNRNVARMGVLLAGLPASVPGSTINRLCGSGLDAVNVLARGIKTNEIGVGIAGGVESMTRAPFVVGKGPTAFARNMRLEDTTMGWRFVNAALAASYGVETMPETAENVAEAWGISREDQDAFALQSQLRASAARESGRFDREIVPVRSEGRKGTATMVERDEHPRADTTLEGLAKLPAAFRASGTVTAGNASGINDGSCALLLSNAESAERFGLTPRARIVDCTVTGVEPRIMGIGPVSAVRKLLARNGLDIDKIDVIELNEAFAAQSLACLRDLGLDSASRQVNPNGGAIALGHPLGMSGARLVTTALYELDSLRGRFALCAMCIGVGQGIAMLIERV